MKVPGSKPGGVKTRMEFFRIFPGKCSLLIGFFQGISMVKNSDQPVVHAQARRRMRRRVPPRMVSRGNANDRSGMERAEHNT